MRASENINELAIALSKAQGLIKGATKDSNNPFFKSSYADLSSVMDAIREPLSINGLSVSQPISYIGNEWFIETIIIHSSGQWIQSDAVMVPVKDKLNAQAFGSAVTYMRRYCLSSMVGVAAIDDDGEAAAQHSRQQNQQTYPQSKPQVPNLAPQSQPSQQRPPIKDGMTLKQDPPRQSPVLNQLKEKKGL